jgi:PAS domain-containing protein
MFLWQHCSGLADLCLLQIQCQSHDSCPSLLNCHCAGLPHGWLGSIDPCLYRRLFMFELFFYCAAFPFNVERAAGRCGADCLLDDLIGYHPPDGQSAQVVPGNPDLMRPTSTRDRRHSQTSLSALPDGPAEFLNQRWLEYTGLSLKEGLDWGGRVTVHPEDIARFLSEWKAALTEEKPLETEARSRRVDGEYRWLLICAVPLRNEMGKIVK